MRRRVVVGSLLLLVLMLGGCRTKPNSATPPATPAAPAPLATAETSTAPRPVLALRPTWSPERTSAGRAIVINPDEFWATSTCGWPVTPMVRATVEDGVMRFENDEPNWRHLWLLQPTLQIDWQRYPIAVLKYRAAGIKAEHYLLWMADGTGSMNGGVRPFLTKDVINDACPHELRTDLRTLAPKGNLQAMWLALHHDETPERAFFELLELRFEAAPESDGALPATDPLVQVQVLDENLQQLAGADIVVDYTFANWAQVARTNEVGIATVVPYHTPDGQHMARVSKFGYVTKEVRGDMLRRAVRLEKAAYCGGQVVDPVGKPVEDAIVRLELRENNYGGNERIILPWNVRTDAHGRWRSPPLPANLEALGVGVVHADYGGDGFDAWRVPAAIEELRTLQHVRTLEVGVTVRGVVLSDEGKPVPGVLVVTRDARGGGGWGRQVTADAEGRFEIRHHPAGLTQILARKKNVGSAEVNVEVKAEMEEVRLQFRAPLTAAAAQETVEAYIRAALVGNEAEVSRLVVPGAGPAQQYRDLQAVTGAIKIAHVKVNGDTARVLTDPVEVKPEARANGTRLAFRLQRANERWLIRDIDYTNDAPPEEKAK